jgi:hypothetical protein
MSAAPMASGAMTPAPAPIPVQPNRQDKEESSDEFGDILVHRLIC